MNELVSIIMPSYNTANYIEASIESVQHQTYENWELIIVDDCSTDNTDEIVKPLLSDARIRYLKNEKNSGAAISRNRALREAKGKWIAFLDSDDLWLPEKLGKQVAFMEQNGYHFSYTNYEEINMAGEKTGVRVTGPKKITKTGMFNYCWPGCLTVMYDAEIVGLIQIVDIKKNNDYAMWLKVCRKADCYLLDECLAQYRKGRAGSVSTHGIRTMIGWHFKLFREAENAPKMFAAFYMFRNLFFGVLKKKIFVSLDGEKAEEAEAVSESVNLDGIYKSGDITAVVKGESIVVLNGNSALEGTISDIKESSFKLELSGTVSTYLYLKGENSIALISSDNPSEKIELVIL